MDLPIRLLVRLSPNLNLEQEFHSIADSDERNLLDREGHSAGRTLNHCARRIFVFEASHCEDRSVSDGEHQRRQLEHYYLAAAFILWASVAYYCCLQIWYPEFLKTNFQFCCALNAFMNLG